MASEKISFENADDGRRTDGRTMDACLYYKLTYEPSAQGSQKVKDIKNCILFVEEQIRRVFDDN